MAEPTVVPTLPAEPYAAEVAAVRLARAARDAEHALRREKPSASAKSVALSRKLDNACLAAALALADAVCKGSGRANG